MLEDVFGMGGGVIFRKVEKHFHSLCTETKISLTSTSQHTALMFSKPFYSIIFSWLQFKLISRPPKGCDFRRSMGKWYENHFPIDLPTWSVDAGD